MPFGRYKGKQMKDVPAVYLLWLDFKGCEQPAVKQYINMHRQTLTKEAGVKRIKA